MRPTFSPLIFLTLISVCFWACEHEPSVIIKPEKRSYAFFVAGHTYGGVNVQNEGFHPPFQAKLDLLRSDSLIQFGVLTGDITKDGTEQQWNGVDAAVNRIDKPVHFAVGNHDMRNRQVFESRYGKTYYHFRHQKDLFIILDPNIDHWNISGDQLSFLRSTLAQEADSADRVFVFFHQMIWWGDDNLYRNLKLNSKEGRLGDPNFWSEVEPLFTVLDLPVYMFCGDVGAAHWTIDCMYDQYANITLLASGMGEGIGDNFLIVEVTEDEPVRIRLIDLGEMGLEEMGRIEECTTVR